jgi:hypothetical protein
MLPLPQVGQANRDDRVNPPPCKTFSNIKLPNSVPYSMGGISEQVKQMIFDLKGYLFLLSYFM